MLWCARVVWVVLPVTTGAALGDALSGWSRAPATTAAVLVWAAWAAGVLALLAPRPLGATVLRVVAPAALLVALVTIPAASAGVAAISAVNGVAAALAVLAAPVATACAEGVAYGDERRFPLRAPLGLLLGPLPLAVVLVEAAVASGPILLADRRWLAGGLAVAVGGPLIALLARSLDALSYRWVVLVPAGLVVVDRLSLTDPVLVTRENVEVLRPNRAVAAASGTLDLRMGTAIGAVELRTHEPATFVRRRGRHDAELVESRSVLVAPLRPAALLARAGERGIPVAAAGGYRATPPPTSTSPS